MLHRGFCLFCRQILIQNRSSAANAIVAYFTSITSTNLIHSSEPPIANIPEHEALKRIFPPEEVELKPKLTAEGDPQASESSSVVLWLFPGHTMPRFVQLLRYPAYRYHVIEGLVVSAGELTESLVRGMDDV